jgi:hypothetical protein
MGRPYRPVRELEAHLARGELEFALALARGIARERARPLGLELTLRFLPLLAAQRPDAFDRWALRWLERWCAEAGTRASVDEAVELVAGLAEISIDPERGVQNVRAVLARRPGLGG